MWKYGKVKTTTTAQATKREHTTTSTIAYTNTKDKTHSQNDHTQQQAPNTSTRGTEERMHATCMKHACTHTLRVRKQRVRDCTLSYCAVFILFCCFHLFCLAPNMTEPPAQHFKTDANSWLHGRQSEESATWAPGQQGCSDKTLLKICLVTSQQHERNETCCLRHLRITNA